MPNQPDFAEFVLSRLPDLARRLAQADCTAWLAAQDSLVVDGQMRWLSWGDRLTSGAEMKLAWARQHDLIDAAKLGRLQNEFGDLHPDPDVEAVAVEPAADSLKEKDDGR